MKKISMFMLSALLIGIFIMGCGNQNVSVEKESSDANEASYTDSETEEMELKAEADSNTESDSQQMTEANSSTTDNSEASDLTDELSVSGENINSEDDQTITNFKSTLYFTSYPNYLIDYVASSLNCIPEATLTLNYDTREGKATSASIQFEYIGGDGDPDTDPSYEIVHQDMSMISNASDGALAYLSNPSMDVQGSMIYLNVDVSLDAPFNQYISTYFLYGQDFASMEQNHNDNNANSSVYQELEVGGNYINYPYLELKVSW